MIVTLTARADFAPVPHVEIRMEETVDWWGGHASHVGSEYLDGGSATVTGDLLDGGDASAVTFEVPVGTDTVTLWRSCQGVRMKVRQGVERSFGVMGWQDFEAGFDVPSTYELECFYQDEIWGLTPLGTIPLGSVTLPWVGPENGVLVQQPLDPTLSVVAVNLNGSWPAITRETVGGLALTQGARVPVFYGGGPRQGVKGAALDFGVESRADAGRLWDTLGSPDRPQLQSWLIRAHQSHLPRVFFCHVGALTETDIDLRDGGEWSRFQAVVDEIAPPAPGLLISPLSYDDLDVSFESYTDMDAEFATYSARDTAWSYAGASGGA